MNDFFWLSNRSLGYVNSLRKSLGKYLDGLAIALLRSTDKTYETQELAHDHSEYSLEQLIATKIRLEMYLENLAIKLISSQSSFTLVNCIQREYDEKYAHYPKVSWRYADSLTNLMAYKRSLRRCLESRVHGLNEQQAEYATLYYIEEDYRRKYANFQSEIEEDFSGLDLDYLISLRRALEIQIKRRAPSLIREEINPLVRQIELDNQRQLREKDKSIAEKEARIRRMEEELEEERDFRIRIVEMERRPELEFIPNYKEVTQQYLCILEQQVIDKYNCI